MMSCPFFPCKEQHDNPTNKRNSGCSTSLAENRKLFGSSRRPRLTKEEKEQAAQQAQQLKEQLARMVMAANEAEGQDFQALAQKEKVAAWRQRL
jgi:hypothetical protein